MTLRGRCPCIPTEERLSSRKWKPTADVFSSQRGGANYQGRAAIDGIGEPRWSASANTCVDLNLLFRRLHFASGSGRSWNFTTLGFVPLPPSMWKGDAVAEDCPQTFTFQPAWDHRRGLSEKNRRTCFSRFMISISVVMLLGLFSFHDQPVRRIFCFGTTSTADAVYNVSGAMSAPFGQAMVGPSIKNFLK